MPSDSATALSRGGHASHARRCLVGLPSSQVEVDPSKVACLYYCLGILDLLGVIDTKSSEVERSLWREWLWEQQTAGKYGTGFRPGPFVTPADDPGDHSEFNQPHLVMTYTGLLSLAILRDDFARLDRPGIIRFLASCQQADGSFTDLPNAGESDLRLTYCAFAISSMLDDWSGVDLDRALGYIQRCYTYEGGYGQTPLSEALAGTTYCAVASLALAPDTAQSPRASRMNPEERSRTVRWLVQNQAPSGGFSGRTGKDADACYCFWCGASLSILGHGDLVDKGAMADFLGRCQFKFGGIAKVPGDDPDPYHTYLSLVALAIYPADHGDDASWDLPRVDALLNATEATAKWVREHVPGPR